ncbi:response regulator transcription factor [Nitrosophilus labii]|uniref:response regulator transcription factor n=1 Tax=Nitrosophilus labii TaxID=2706014 RepID=UPI0016570424|nr:response regulator transcription factor [Nitrosophilus labii]
MSRVLLIEDDIEMQNLIKDYLSNYQYEVFSFEKPKEALQALEKESFDIVVLDLMLPQMDGFDICKEIKRKKDIPIIISSARGDIGNKIMGFELGADDYLAKPYEPRELVLRIEAILRRVKKEEALKISDFYIDEKNRLVKLDDYEIDFTKIELEIFLYLIKNRGKVLSREQIINSTSLPPDTKNRTIDMHISNIRFKIGDDSKNPKYIKSVWGIGYKFI